MGELPADAHGPAMAALWDDRARKFAWLMACGEENAAEAARAAGYSGHRGTSRVRAHYLMRNRKVIEAIREAAQKVLDGLAPLAIRRMRDILENPKHRAHARMIEVVLDRTGFAAQTEHRVTVEHKADLRELEELARRLALENGIAPERFVGLNGPGAEAAGKVIEGEAVELKDGGG